MIRNSLIALILLAPTLAQADTATPLFSWDWSGADGRTCVCEHPFWEVDVNHWQTDRREHLTEVGISPMFRIQRGPVESLGGARPFVEGGLDLRLLNRSGSGLVDLRGGTEVGFSDQIAYGLAFGERNQFTISQRFQFERFATANLNLPGNPRPSQSINLSYEF